MSEGSDSRDRHSGDDPAAPEQRRAEREARRRERLARRVKDAGEEPPEAEPGQAAPPRVPRTPRSTIARRRLVALAAVLGLGLLGVAFVPAAKRLGGDGAPVAAPPEPRKTIEVTIPEGYGRDQVAAVAKEAGIEGDYMKESVSFKGFPLGEYGAARAKNLEGFLFPATYELFRNATAKDLVAKQLEAFEQSIEGVDLDFAKSKNLTTYGVVKVASMIEREAQIDEDRANISSVIYNRLADGMPLGIDATIRFEDSNYDEQLLESRLGEDTPYNTHINAGLPPGPIGSPGLASLEAAADPADNEFRFFVVKPGTCGEHVFTETEDEFFEAEAEYQAALRAEGGSPTEC